LKKKGFKEERVTKVGGYAIGTSTTLESNKSLERMGCEPYYRPAGAALKQVGMGTGPDKPHCLVCDVVDQQPVWLYMAVPIGLPVSCQGMRAVSWFERFPHLQFLHHGL
jgi:hypothetical protein